MSRLDQLSLPRKAEQESMMLGAVGRSFWLAYRLQIPMGFSAHHSFSVTLFPLGSRLVLFCWNKNENKSFCVKFNIDGAPISSRSHTHLFEKKSKQVDLAD